MAKKLYILQVEARDTMQLAGCLNTISKMVHDGYKQSVDQPCQWSLKEKEPT